MSWPQNSKFGYGTIGVQANPTQPVQTNTPFMRIDGDIVKNVENVKNTSIQNIRNNASTIVEGNETTEGTLNMELSPIDAVWFLFAALGTLTSVDVSSATDGTVWEHTIEEVDCDLKPLSIEIKKGGCAGGLGQPDGQNTMITRAYGAFPNSVAINIEEGILKMEAEINAYWAFDVAKLVANESPEASTTAITNIVAGVDSLTITSIAHLLSVWDLVVVDSVTPSAYNGSYKVTDVIDVDNFVVSASWTFPAYVSGGAVTKQSMWRFKKGSTRGLVIGDSVRLYEYATDTYEVAIVTALDFATDTVWFTSIVSTLFTVANDSKIELVQKNVVYDSPVLFGFKDARVRIAQGGVANAYLANPKALKTLNFNIANNLQVDSQTEYNTVKETGSDYTAEMVALYETNEDRDHWRNKTELSMVIEIDNARIISATDTNNQTFSIVIEVPRFVYETFEAPVATGSLIEQTIAALILHDAVTDESVKIKVYNDKPDTYYQP